MDFEKARADMVMRLRALGVVHEAKVVAALEKVPRHQFLPPSMGDLAYIDRPLDIGEGQTISAPHMVAIMAEALELRPGMKVLEVGAGSGYHAAVMAELIRPGGKVYSLERIEKLANQAWKNLEAAGYGNDVDVIVADGSKGLKEHAPYDRISVAAAAPRIPEPLMDQLKPDGIMLVPVGDPGYQEMKKVRKKGKRYEIEEMGAVMFVPLVGEHGY
ncbi:MAG: Protein-L-isoaspartate O-methyltransferase [Methanomassiliicoccales archaeon PtaU1.Bin124]|nr:MAG: Protein-L-isoaspartate O-methyltransferase [Methanomassiliicoccales archaeon PtaU1.Bin124]